MTQRLTADREILLQRAEADRLKDLAKAKAERAEERLREANASKTARVLAKAKQRREVRDSAKQELVASPGNELIPLSLAIGGAGATEATDTRAIAKLQVSVLVPSSGRDSTENP